MTQLLDEADLSDHTTSDLADTIELGEGSSEIEAQHFSSKPESMFLDAELQSMRSRALAYMAAGVPVLVRGPAGVGKTTLALDVAHATDRPVSVVTGEYWMTSADLVGRETGSTTRQVRDQYVHRVQKTESRSMLAWQDAILTTAMEKGHTLVYDEFTRAPPELNGILLSVLEERVLFVNHPARGRRAIKAHPDFRMILTSNPATYVGVCDAPEALLDRVVTFDLSELSIEAETGILMHRTGMDPAQSRTIVEMVRRLRRHFPAGAAPTIRTALFIARLSTSLGAQPGPSCPSFAQICLDVLMARLSGPTAESNFKTLLKQELASLSPRVEDRSAA